MTSRPRNRRAFVKPVLLSGALGLAALLLLLVLSQAAQATNITVNTTTDELNADGDCSLREAIQAVTTDTAIDACATGDLDITSDLTIYGAGAASTIIQACDSSGGPCTGIDRVIETFGMVTIS